MGALDRLITGAGAGPVRRDRHVWQREICNNSDLPAICRLIALAISVYTNEAGTQGVWLTSTDIAGLTGLRALTTVNGHLRTLVGSGWLSTQDGALFLAWPAVLGYGQAAVGERGR